MKVGVSSSCLFPMLTEDSVEVLFKNSINDIEVFINSPSEHKKEFAKKLLSIKNKYQGNVLSVHPCTSEYEGVTVFGRYPRRFDDTAEEYKKIFELTAILGADIVAFHGARAFFPIEKAFYFERFDKLSRIANTFGVRLAQENVVNFFSQTPEFIAEMIRELPNSSMILDIKQAKRAGVDPFNMLNAMGRNLCNIHISDNNEEYNCLIPGAGSFDYEQLISELKSKKYVGALMIEVYRGDFKGIEQLIDSRILLEKIVNKSQ